MLDLQNASVRDCTNKHSLSIIKAQSQIDSLVYPETMAKTLIKDAPTFFKMTWAIVKGFIDSRTAGKIEFVSGRKGVDRIKELSNPSTLPSDYGGYERTR